MLPKSSQAAKVDDLDHPGLRIDLDFADVRASGKGEVRGIVERRLVEPGLELVQRIVMRHICGERDVTECLAAIGASDGELAVLEFDVGFRGFEQVRSDLLALGDDLVQRLDDRRAAHRQRTRSVGAHTERNPAGVAVHDLDILDGYAEPARDDLRRTSSRVPVRDYASR